MNTEKRKPGSESGEDLDVRAVHGQLLREKSEPWEMLRAAPGWLKHGIYAPLLIGGLIYLFNASGGFKWNEYYEGPLSTTGRAIQIPVVETGVTEEPVVSTSLRDEGATVYKAVCVACHQPTGLGLPAVFPPLAGSEWVAGNDRRLALIVLHGLMGPIEVKGQPWNLVMPPQGMTLDDRKIAAVLTYVRSEWGNDAPEVSPETVAAMREKYAGHAPWTAETLNAEIPGP